MSKAKELYYEKLGISREVLAFGEQIVESLRDRFAAIDDTAECNQLKVIQAMQENRVSEACLYGTTGYGYNAVSYTHLRAHET